MPADIMRVEHKLRGPYAEQTIITWEPLTTETLADDMVQELEKLETFDMETREDLESQRDYEERRANEYSDRVDELEEDIEKAERERDDAQNERDAAEDKLEALLNTPGWTVERERDLEFRTSESYALNRLCVKLKNWAGQNKQKADVLRFIEECKQECDKAAQEIVTKYERMVA